MSTGPWVRVAHCLFPKSGNTPDECEDNLRILPSNQNEIPGSCVVRVVVSHGATESAFSGIWSKYLTYRIAKAALKDDPKVIIDAATEMSPRWLGAVRQRPLPWYAEQKILEGAFATVVVLEVSGGAGATSGTWKACAIGDSCMFRIGGDTSFEMLPNMKPEDFGSRPFLIPTKISGIQDIGGHFQFSSGKWNAGDRFIVATDALSQMLAKQQSNPEYLRKAADAIATRSRDELESWFQNCRDSRFMRNDDIAAVVVML